MKINCNGCTCCCRMIGPILDGFHKDPEKFPAHSHVPLSEFPHSVRSDGSCEKLGLNGCTIYEDRPTICSVDKMSGLSDKSDEDYLEDNLKACKTIQDYFNEIDRKSTSTNEEKARTI